MTKSVPCLPARFVEFDAVEMEDPIEGRFQSQPPVILWSLYPPSSPVRDVVQQPGRAEHIPTGIHDKEKNMTRECGVPHVNISSGQEIHLPGGTAP